jgi:hypothetical protein
MTPRCDYCGRPATWHVAWKTPAMPSPAFFYACDEHRQKVMVPIDEPITTYLDPTIEDTKK